MERGWGWVRKCRGTGGGCSDLGGGGSSSEVNSIRCSRMTRMTSKGETVVVPGYSCVKEGGKEGRRKEGGKEDGDEKEGRRRGCVIGVHVG